MWQCGSRDLEATALDSRYSAMMSNGVFAVGFILIHASAQELGAVEPDPGQALLPPEGLPPLSGEPEIAAPHHTRLSYRRHIYEAALLTALQAKLGGSCYLYPCSLLYLGCSSPSLPDSDTSGLHALQ